MIEALSLPFFQRVLAAGLLASVACGIVGSYVVAKRISTLAGGVSHAAFGGVGLGYWLGFPPMLGAAAFGLLASSVIGVAYRRIGTGLDTLTSMIWAVGMALGLIFVSLAPGYAPDLMSFLFGSLLFVPWDYVQLVAALDVAIVLAVLLFGKEFQAVCFDEEFAEVSGVPVERTLLALLALTALAVVTLIRVVGVILALALLTIPAMIARHWSDSLRGMMWLAVPICAGCVVVGLLGSWALDARADVSLPPGPLIIVVATLLYALSAFANGRRRARLSSPA
ncbi:MAG: metal ABC transporter permease [Myxococcales bacterium]|nr:metal ABC transporter permease [Myxococcales bacterium]